MSLVFCDGWDDYGSLWMRYENVTLSKVSLGVTTSLSRSGGGALLFSSQSAQVSQFAYAWKNFSNLSTVICGFALFVGPGGRSAFDDMEVLRFMDGSTIQVSLRITQAGAAYFTRNGTVLGSATSIGFTMNAWHYIEVKVTFSSSAGVCQLVCDGTQYINLTSQNTQATVNAQTNQFQIGSAASGGGGSPVTVAIDDLYLCSTAGSVNNSFLGDIAVKSLMPTGNGSSLQYTKNAASWAANTVQWIGRRVKDSNGNIQQVTANATDCKTGGSAPSWNVTVGGTTTDNHVTWTNMGADTDYLEVAENPVLGLHDWPANVVVPVGYGIVDPNLNVQVITSAGTTGTNAPTWNSTTGGTTGDGTVTWTNMGPLSTFEDAWLSDNTIGDQSRFTFPSLTGSAVKAVAVTTRARKDDASVRSYRGAAKSGATVADSGADLVLSTTYQIQQGIFETDPNTGVAWTISGVNAAELGIKTTA